MTPKARKHAAALKQAYNKAEAAANQMSQSSMVRKHVERRLSANRYSLALAERNENVDAILAMPIPKVANTLIIWDLKPGQFSVA